MNTQISIPIPTTLFIKFFDFLREHGSNRDPVDAVATAIEYWMDNASWKKEDLMPEIFSTESRGYTWKNKDTSLFLPHGTEIRMRYMGQYHYAKVEGDEIKYQGEPTSPSALANTIARKNRNAWKYLWIKRPSEKEWALAENQRERQRAAREILSDLLDSKPSQK